MALIGRLHPLLIHFPIALVLGAVLAEGAAAVTKDDRWRLVAVRNLRVGAAAALAAAGAGWWFARAPGMDATPLLEFHRWLGTAAAAVTVGAALAASAGGVQSRPARWMYRIALCGAGALVGVTAHLGGLLVWGADFLRP
jgi:uncharacterized membrane protein